MYSLNVVNDLTELRRMSAWLVDAAQSLDLNPERVSELELCANEALTNIISYAYEGPGRHTISLRLRRGPDGVTLEIEDDGRPFSPLAAIPAQAPRDLADAAIGGLGIKLIRGLMADCAYLRRDDKNILTLTAHT